MKAATLLLLAFACSQCSSREPAPETPPAKEEVPVFAGAGVREVDSDPREKHLRNLRQLTFEGENAEAYWNADASRIVLQHRGAGIPADQVYTLKPDGTDLRLASTGTGKCTCAYFLPGGKRVMFASTHGASPKPPAPPDMSRGYVWLLHPEYDLWSADLDGKDLKRITDSPGYDAEAVVSPDGKRIVFTSRRNGDLDLYTMNVDGTGLVQVTKELGYDGGAFFTPDSRRLVYRAFHPKEGKEAEEYKDLLAHDLIRPMALQIMTCDLDGSNRVQVTDNGKANFGPYMHPDGKRIIYASNQADPKGRDFDLWIVNADGTGNERVTFTEEFDGFPMFTPDGKTLMFCSNRHGAERGNTNVFLADWVD